MDGAITAAVDYAWKAIQSRSDGAVEAALRDALNQALPRMFPSGPWWVTHHAEGSETHTLVMSDGQMRHRFIDSLVGLTTIEYESDLRNTSKFNTGYAQVQEHCAGVIGSGNDPYLVRGVLSDTVRWHVYAVEMVGGWSSVSGVPPTPENINLVQIDTFDLTSSDVTTHQADRFLEFLERTLGRQESVPLDADSISRDLGLNSRFSSRHIDNLHQGVRDAFDSNPTYGDLIRGLWSDFIGTVGSSSGGESPDRFDMDEYVDEFYLLTLAKMMCANVLDRGALHSEDDELTAILNGSLFEAKGLANLVEYDYFGWLHEGGRLANVLCAAREMQRDLAAYNYEHIPPGDLFGQLMAQLAQRSRRLLLGQEWTPSWLAAKLAKHVVDAVPDGEDPRLVDMCCGSGTMLIEASRLTKQRIAAEGLLPLDERVQRLADSVTGFDVDPLAVMLAKIGWILVARDWLEELEWSCRVEIPVYHADSLFVTTPISHHDHDENTHYELKIADRRLSLPKALVSAERRVLFDQLVTAAQRYAHQAATEPRLDLPDQDVLDMLGHSEVVWGAQLGGADRNSAKRFLAELVRTLHALECDGRNGLWTFIIKNSFRPALVAGQFNGVISNPPWLALSKIADNPYRDELKERAKSFSIQPVGAAHLHTEMATIFFLDALDRYLEPNALVACVLPETVLNGRHHTRFRRGEYTTADQPVDLLIEQIWRVESGTFKNEAIAIIGRRTGPTPTPAASIPGASVNKTARDEPLTFTMLDWGRYTAWSDEALPNTPYYDTDGAFRQGADLMPRLGLFHEFTQSALDRQHAVWRVKSASQTGPLGYFWKDAKHGRGFQFSPSVLSVPEQFVFNGLLSHDLTPFRFNEPARLALPFERDSGGAWAPVSMQRISAVSGGTQGVEVFAQILELAAQTTLKGKTSTSDLFAYVDTRLRKLTTQTKAAMTGYLVAYGAGGALPCAAYMPLQEPHSDRLIVDQTLYWATVQCEEEALYYVGALSSPAVRDIIRPFQPRGAQGERHLHKLPLVATPTYQGSEPKHVAVAQATRDLIREHQIAAQRDPQFEDLHDLNWGTLAQRRGRIHAQIQGLSAYPPYEATCRDLYAVAP